MVQDLLSVSPTILEPRSVTVCCGGVVIKKVWQGLWDLCTMLILMFLTIFFGIMMEETDVTLMSLNVFKV